LQDNFFPFILKLIIDQF